MLMEGKIYESHQVDGTMAYGNGSGCDALIQAQTKAQRTAITVANLFTNRAMPKLSFFFFFFSFLLF